MNNDKLYRLTAQKIGSEAPHDPAHNSDVDVVIVSFIAPDGRQKGFIGRSGGYDLGSLPGLNEELDGNSNNGVTASYRFQYDQQWAVRLEMDPRYTYNGKEGFFLRLVSPEYVDRGLQEDKLDGYGAFAIHPDGPSGDYGIFNDGSTGCITIQTDDVPAFMDFWNAIPREQRPISLEVLPAREILNDISLPPIGDPQAPILPTPKLGTETPSR